MLLHHPSFWGSAVTACIPCPGRWGCSSWMCACAAPCKPRFLCREMPCGTSDTPQGPSCPPLAVPHRGYLCPCCHLLTSGSTKLGLNHCSVTVTLNFILRTVASAPGRFHFHLHMTSLVHRGKCLILCISVLLMEWQFLLSFYILFIYLFIHKKTNFHILCLKKISCSEIVYS